MRLFVVCCLVVLAVAPAYSQNDGVNPNPDLSLLWGQVAAQPEDFSVVCMPLENRAGTVLINADEPFPLASVSKLAIFVEYARRVEAGQIPIDEMVNVSLMNRYDVDRTDRGAHERFLERYPVGTQFISLYDVAADGMIQYSSNAASDYVLDRIGLTDWNGLFASLYMTDTTRPHALNVIPLMMSNHETGQPDIDEVPGLSLLAGETMFRRYLTEDQWRADEFDYRSRWGRRFPDWDVQTAILEQHTAHGTTYDWLNMMLAIYGPAGSLSDYVKTLTRNALRWDENAAINVSYAEYGSKLGYYSGGTIALVAYGDPFGGSPVISAAFFRDVPRRTYYDMLREDSIGRLAHWMNFTSCSGLVDQLRV